MRRSSPSIVRRLASTLQRQLARQCPGADGKRPSGKTLILFYNTMQDQPIETEQVPLPEGLRAQH
jgi:hypothetical protein